MGKSKHRILNFLLTIPLILSLIIYPAIVPLAVAEEGTNSVDDFGEEITSNETGLQDEDLYFFPENNPDIESDEEETLVEETNNDFKEDDNSIATGDIIGEVNLENEVNSNITITEDDSLEDDLDEELDEIEEEMDNSEDDIPEEAGETEELEETNEDNSSISIVSDNEAVVENDIVVGASTGDNLIDDNDGNATIDTGDINIVTNIVNIVNTNIANSDFYFFQNNIYEELEGDIDLSNAADSNTEQLETNESSGALNTTQIVNNNQGTIENNVSITASSGKNSVINNGGNAKINSGDINIVTSIINLLNSNVISSQIVSFIINVFGGWTGDLVLPGGKAMKNLTGEGDFTENSQVIVSNEAYVENEVNVIANTGDNSIENSGGNSSINTGNANIKTNLLNVANSNIQHKSWFSIAINTFGNWIGNIFSLPDGLSINKDSQGVNINNSYSEDYGNPINTNNSSQINSNNFGSIGNNVTITALTGSNSIDSNSGNAEISSGNANILTNISNFVNTNITSDVLFFGIVNVFGLWEGDLAFGRPDLSIEETAVTSPNPAKASGSITYTLTYTNNGDADATEVAIVDDFDEGYLTITDTGGGSFIDNPGEMHWDIGSIPVGDSSSVSYTVTINPEIPFGTTALTNTATINSFEDDWNDEDNTTALSIEVTRTSPVKIVKKKVKSQTVLGSSQSGLPNFQITKTNNADGFIWVGGNVDYTIVLTNEGNGSAYNVVVQDVLTNEVSHVFNTISWELGEVFPREKITIEYTIATNHEIPPGVYTNTVRATGTNSKGNQVSSLEASSTIEVRLKKKEISQLPSEIRASAETEPVEPSKLDFQEPPQGFLQDFLGTFDEFVLPIWISAAIAIIAITYLKRKENEKK